MLPTKNKLHKLCQEYIEAAVRTVSASEKVITMEQIKRSYGINKPEETLNDYGLKVDPISPFALYPVFLGTNSNEISICALCMAMLVLDNSKMTNMHHISRQVNSALNTLIVTSISEHDGEYEYVYWPTNITMFNEVESGTFNQTTIALSTLDKIGFLKKLDNLTEESIRKRVQLVVKSLSWIVKHQKLIGGMGSWSYGVKCTSIESGDIDSAMLPSHFCYETLSKYLNFFVSNHKILTIVNDINDNLISQMNDACKMFENWAWNNQNNDGGYKIRSDGSDSSFIHSCMSLLVYYYSFENTNSINVEEPLKKDHFTKVIRYILHNHKNFLVTSDEMLEQYRYEYVITTNNLSNKKQPSKKQTGTKMDTYEIMLEFFYLNNSYKVLKSRYKNCITSSQMRKIRELNYIGLERILKKVKKIRIGASNDFFAIEGTLLGLATHYPIYCLYDAQICFLMFLEAKNEKLRLISFPKTRKISIIVYIFVALTFLGLAIKIGMSDTISSILLSIASYIGINIIGKFFPKIKH